MPRGIRNKPLTLKKVCEICGKEYLAKTKLQTTCGSETCKATYKEKKHREWLLQKSLEKYKNNPNAKTCKICGYMCMDLKPHITLYHKMIVKDYCKKFNIDESELISDAANANRSKAQKESTNPNKRRFKSGSENPAYQHGGALSPFSKKFIKYDALSEKEKEYKILEIAKTTNENKLAADNCALTVEYYVSHFGLTKEEAECALAERQSTFSLEKCIKKYGEEAGRKRWLERQEKWQNNYKKQNYSKISQELFIEVDKRIKYFNLTSYYATKGEEGCNNEKRIVLEDLVARADYYVEELNLIIEFDGDYWHGEARGNQERDANRQKKLEAVGYIVYRVQEREFKKNREETIRSCVNKILEVMGNMHKV